jgi:hypothetical protein
MKAYVLDIFPKIHRYSSNKDLETHILNKAWVLVDENNEQKVTYRFQEKDAEIIIGVDARGTIGKWQFLEDGKSLMIQVSDAVWIFKHSFIDETVLALKLDNDKSEFVVFFNENAQDRFKDNTLYTIRHYLKDKVKDNLPGGPIDDDRFSKTYPIHWSNPIHISASFNIEFYPELEGEIAIINEKIGDLKTKSHAVEILIAYCEKRSVPVEISKFNKEFLEHLNNQKFPIALIDKIFKEHKFYTDFTSEFKEYLREQIV